jgi:hypothetical protein
MTLWSRQRISSGTSVKGSWILSTTWLKIRMRNVFNVRRMTMKDGMAVMKTEIL